MSWLIRGTTPTIEVELPFETAILAEAYITLSQNGKIVLDKSMSECKCNLDTLSVTLTQEETLMLDCKCHTEIQVRARTTDGSALASDVITVATERILKDGVI